MSPDPCERPVIYFLDWVEEAENTRDLKVSRERNVARRSTFLHCQFNLSMSQPQSLILGCGRR
ncbi:hypothetical protein ACSBR1_035491 [Camellia fascicularis]